MIGSVNVSLYFLAHVSIHPIPSAGLLGSAALAGPWQFYEKLRVRALNLHRWLGRFYLLEVGLGSIAGFAMAVVSEQGLPLTLASERWPYCGFSLACKPTGWCGAGTS